MKTFPLKEAPLSRWDREQGDTVWEGPSCGAEQPCPPTPVCGDPPRCHRGWTRGPHAGLHHQRADSGETPEILTLTPDRRMASASLWATFGEQWAGHEVQSRCGRRQTGSQEEGAQEGPARSS